ncbi:MAG: bifunctional glutamate N-acetyltransferase/amino-acid acetyltransferase ArgJ [Anaerolineae bacterium]|nr:bifunctional glutamate N-acetyltransferase/amino-acid acetyltransferase ArgJ [Anaerolineae bacterium]
MTQITPIPNGSITTASGFQAAGLSAGLKASGALDLALVYSEAPCAAAAVFTTNKVKAAPVLYDRQALAANSTKIHACLINSGCANACTGDIGMAASRETAAQTERALGIKAGSALVMSTGVIGTQLPVAKIVSALPRAVAALGTEPDAGLAAAQAIMTTDTQPKAFAVRVHGEMGTFTIAGMAKGSGMIHPNMATMLSVLVTDAPVVAPVLDTALRSCLENSFNAITVDGDTSTNDTVLLLANGQSGLTAIRETKGEMYEAFAGGLLRVAQHLAQEIVRDGEGATHFVRIDVRGAASRADAKRVAKAIANSLLVKTAIYGHDANWGRILCAAGYSGAELNPDRVELWLGDLHVVHEGKPYDTNEERAQEILAQYEVAITMNLQLGTGEATVWTSDLSHRYVDINAHYRT